MTTILDLFRSDQENLQFCPQAEKKAKYLKMRPRYGLRNSWASSLISFCKLGFFCSMR
jgi:hypothetical protein